MLMVQHSSPQTVSDFLLVNFDSVWVIYSLLKTSLNLD